MLKLGVFDSGIGGLSLLRSLRRLRPSTDVFYIADWAHAPYGPKSDDEINERCAIICHELIEVKKVDMVLVACNTATSAAIEALRKRYPKTPFIGIEPYINIINQRPLTGELAVLVTQGMFNSQRFKKLQGRLDSAGKLTYVPLKNLATLVEKYFAGELAKSDLKIEVEQELSDLIGRYDGLILGCTHYPLIEDVIEEVVGASCYSPCDAVIHHLLTLSSNQVTTQIPELFNFTNSIIKNDTFQWEKRAWNKAFKD